MISIKSKREIELMKEACKITALTYDYIEKIIKPHTEYTLENIGENNESITLLWSDYYEEFDITVNRNVVSKTSVPSCTLEVTKGFYRRFRIPRL